MAAPPKPVVGKAVSPRQATAVVSTRRISESNLGIVYNGRWRDARYRSYAGDHVRYAQTSGATATYRFYANSVAWIGPVGPTRGKARIAIDGKVVATIDLRRSRFDPRVTLFHRSWKHVATHTLTITVVGSGRPVAIDEFVITR